jgi:subtilisin family serine protease
MAAPHAAGVAALIRSADPNLPPMAVAARLQNTAMPMVCEEVQELGGNVFGDFARHTEGLVCQPVVLRSERFDGRQKLANPPGSAVFHHAVFLIARRSVLSSPPSETYYHKNLNDEGQLLFPRRGHYR